VNIGKNQKNSAETKLSRERNRKNLKTKNSAGLTELSAVFFQKIQSFLKNVLAHYKDLSKFKF
jgi:hypothetical protein